MPLSRYRRRKMEERNDQIEHLYVKNGFPLREIGRIYNLTAGRVHQIMNERKKIRTKKHE